MPRSRGYYRYKREEKIARKKRILDHYRLDNAPHYLDEFLSTHRGSNQEQLWIL